MEPDIQKVSRYGIVASYLEHENFLYWDRQRFVLLASTGLLAFMAMRLPPFDPKASWHGIVVPLVVGLAGLYLSYVWYKAIQCGEFWNDHWLTVLRDIEDEVFPDENVFRKFTPRGCFPYVRARNVMRQLLGLFVVLWSVFFLYTVVLVVVKIATAYGAISLSAP